MEFKSKKRFCILLNGKVKSNPLAWKEWIIFCDELLFKFGIEPTHLAVETQGINSKKVLNYKRNIKKLYSKIDDKQTIEYLSIYVVPEEYKQIAFDWDMHFLMHSSGKKEFIFLGFPEEVTDLINDELIQEKLKDLIAIKKLEVFVMDKKDAPVVYAWGLKKIEDNENAILVKKAMY